MDLNLENKLVLVTGASRGIGAGIAEGFLKEGARVILVARESASLTDLTMHLKKKYSAQKVFSEECDCLSRDDLNSLKLRITEEFGELNVLVANVGSGTSVPDPLPEPEDWSKSWNINFETSYQTASVFLPLLRKSKNSSLLFISSIAGKEAIGAPVDYSTAKTALIGLSKNMSRKLKGEVRVNVLAPGNIYFEGGTWDKKMKQNSESILDMLEQSVPMARFGTVEEIADSATFLCSDRASFITGSVLVVDGGQTVGIL
tara:strand:+ start:1830 stop:2606 length:777 start_codon:yes stop_codon:yes gene_type:complete